MQLLTTITSFLTSRQKILLKRRKVQIKNRPVSRKRLKEQQKTMNISYEMKLVDIKKQLDRKTSRNHHINQIVQNLFYPEVKLNNQQDIELRVKQLNSGSALLGQNWQEEMKLDQLSQQIKLAYLPVDLLNLHEKKWKEFTAMHYQYLMERMSYYLYNRIKIKNKMMAQWTAFIKKLQEKQGKPQIIKCPYLFLQKEEITRHEYWGSMMQEILRKLTEAKDIHYLNQFLPTFFTAQRCFNFIPAEIYQLVLTRNALANYQQLTNAHISNLIKFMKYKNRIKYSPLVKIATPQKGQQDIQINHFGRKLATSIINNPQLFTREDFMNIFIVINTSKKRMNILTQQLLNKSQSIMPSLLNDLTFQNILTYLNIYAMFTNKPNIQFLQILKFDLYRKCSSESNYHPLIVITNKIKGRRLIFKNYTAIGTIEQFISLQGYDLLVKVAQSLTKMISKLKSQEVIQLLNTCFNNQLQQPAVIEIISTEIVKKAKEYSLQTLAKSFFKITLLGHRSKILSKFVFEQYISKYHSQLKRYKQEDTFLLPTQDDKPSEVLNLKQIHLQQCLVMMIWTLIAQLGDKLKTQIKLDDLLTLIPIKLDSMDPLAIELSNIINQALHQYSLFPQIQWLFAPGSFPMGRLREFYRGDFGKKQIELLMWEQSKLTNQFIENYNFKAHMFLSQRWSSLSTYSADKYLQYSSTHTDATKPNCFFNKQLILPSAFLQKRSNVIKEISKKESVSSSKFFKKKDGNKQRKFYDLLL